MVLAYMITTWFLKTSTLKSPRLFSKDILLLCLIMPPTLKKWGTYWFRLVRMYVCVCVFMFKISS